MFKQLSIFLFSMFLFVSCSSMVPIYYNQKTAPKIDITKYKTISVEPLNGDPTNEFFNALNSKLLETKKLKVLSRNNLAPVIRENILSPSSNMSKVKTADLLISGDVFDSYDVDRERITGGTRINETARTKASLQVIDAKTGEILWTGSSKGKKYAQFTQYDGDNFDWYGSKKDLLAISRDQAIEDFLSVVSPSTEFMVIHVFKNDSTPEINEGHDLLFHEKYTEASKKYDEALKNPKISKVGIGHVLFAKAVALMFLNKFNEAIELTKKAQIENPDNKYSPQIDKIIQAKNEYDHLKTMKLL